MLGEVAVLGNDESRFSGLRVAVNLACSKNPLSKRLLKGQLSADAYAKKVLTVYGVGV